MCVSQLLGQIYTFALKDCLGIVSQYAIVIPNNTGAECINLFPRDLSIHHPGGWQGGRWILYYKTVVVPHQCNYRRSVM